MAFNRLFSYAEVDIPKRSGHDEFHRHHFTLLPGTLTPTFWDFVVPGDIISVAPKFELQMAPQATDFIGRVNVRTELFYVPMRTMWGGWKDFITYPADGIGGPAPTDPAYHAKYLPGAKLSGSVSTVLDSFQNNPTYFYREVSSDAMSDLLEQMNKCVDDSLNSLRGLGRIDFSTADALLGAGTLSDYLGFKVSSTTSTPLDISSISSRVASDLLSEYETWRNGYDGFGTDTIRPDPYYILDESIFYDATLNGLELRFTIQISYSNSNKIVSSTIFLQYPSSVAQDVQINNITPFFCYHKIFNDWYMDKRVMKPLLPNALTDSPAQFLANIAYMPKFGGGFQKKYYEGDNLKFYDGKSLFDLRQRLWQKDYFTTMTTQPQSGDASTVQIDTSGDTGEFTIASLRVANAMQLWRERNNLVDPEYGDVMYAQYGEYPDDSITGKAVYLGSCTQELYNKSVYQQGDFNGPSNNPINSVGAKYASPMAVGGNSLCDDYKIREHGIVMAITSIVPEAVYSSGTRRQFHYDTIDDIAFPLLQGVGDQPVYAREIVDTYSGEGDKTVIGYQQRYTEYRFIQDNVSGLLRDGQSLEAFALQRSFTEAPQLGAEFLEIPQTYMDQVSAVGIENSKYGAWIASAWDYRKASRFSALSSMPTLGHMRNTESVRVNKAGNRL